MVRYTDDDIRSMKKVTAKIAADYAMECIKYTAKLDNHWYGAAFEPVLGKLIGML